MVHDPNLVHCSRFMVHGHIRFMVQGEWFKFDVNGELSRMSRCYLGFNYKKCSCFAKNCLQKPAFNIFFNLKESFP